MAVPIFYGAGLLVAALRTILRFGSKYYATHRGDYDASTQTAIDGLLEVAQTLLDVVEPPLQP